MAGSCAAETCEPRQVRKEATVSRILRAPQDCLAGGCLWEHVLEAADKGRAQSL